MNKKLVLSVLSTAVVASMASAAMAKPPGPGFLVGGDVDKYYSLEAFLGDHFDEALNGILENLDDTYYVTPDRNIVGFIDAVYAKTAEDLKAKEVAPTKEHFGDNVYAIVDGEGTYDPSTDTDLPDPDNDVDLVVESVTVLNSAQVEVKFSKAVDEDTVIANDELHTNISVAPFAGAQALQNTLKAELSEDGKTLTITTATGDYFKGTYSLIVDTSVTDTDGNEIEAFTKTFSVNDEVKPEIASVSAKSAGSASGSVEITFSEPVQAGAVIKVNGVQEDLTDGSVKQTVDLSTPLDPAATHTIEIVNLKDAAGNTTPLATKTFTVEVDANAPQVSSVEPKGDKALLVKFNKKVTVASLNSGLVNAIDANSFAAINLGTAAPVTANATSDDQFIIPVDSTLYTNATSRTLNVMFSAGIKDALGNESGAVSKTVTLTKDTTPPAISGLSFAKNNNGDVTSVTVRLSEGVSAMTAGDVATAAGKVRVIAPDGTDVTGTFLNPVAAHTAVDAFATSVKLEVGTGAQKANLQPGAYTFIIGSGFATDASEAGNASTAFTGTLDFGVTTTPDSFTIADPDNDIVSSQDNTNEITVDFGQAVKGGAGAASATNPANYAINGKPLPAGTVITLDAAKEVAKIEIPVETIAKTDTAAVFTIANVQNAAGVTITPVTTTLQITDNTAPVLTSGVLNADNSITFAFSEELAVAPVVGDLVLKINGNEADIANLTVEAGVGSDTGKYVVNLSDLVVYDALADETVIDMDGDGNSTTGDILIGTGDVTSGFKFSTSSLIKSIKLGTVATAPLTAADAANNTAKPDVEVTVK